MTADQWINYISFGITIIGFLVSVYALVQSQKARDIAHTLVERSNAQQDSDRVRALLDIAAKAKDATLRRENDAPKHIAKGRSKDQDLQLLREAHDALRIKTPVSSDETFSDLFAKTAIEIEQAIIAINISSYRDGWKDARVALQSLIPKLEQEDRKLRNRTILGDSV